MGTTARDLPEGGRSGRASGRDAAAAGAEDTYDLLIAATLGAAVGAGIALMLLPMVSRPEPTLARRVARAGGKGVKRIGRAPGQAAEKLGEYLAAAREAIDDTVESELRDLRKAARRQRRRFGI